MIEWNRIVLLGRDAGRAEIGALAPDQRFVELHSTDAERIAQADRQHGRRGDRERILRRFQHGFRYFAIEEERGLIAWFWAVHGVPRYFDEMAWLLELDDTMAWGRDAFVAPDRRGRRLLAAMMDLAAAEDERPMRFFSDVSASNRPSLRAHVALGFHPLATVQSLAIGSRLLLRGRPPACLPPPTAIRTSRRWLWMSQEERHWHQQQIA